MKVKVRVDNKIIQCEAGYNLLHACLENGIYIPNLCYIKEMKRPLASCRLCFVEIEGEKLPVTSCTQTVIGGMVVRTDSASVRRLQRSALEMLLSVHDLDCGHCPVGKNCELHRIARMLKVNLKSISLDRHLKKAKIDDSHPFLNYHPNRCVLCGRCEYICKDRNGKPFLSFIKRGLDTMVSIYWDENDRDNPCETCLLCIDICPVGAITGKP